MSGKNKEERYEKYWNLLGPEDFMDDYGYGSTLPLGGYDPNLCEVKNGCLSMKSRMLWNNKLNSVKKKAYQNVTSSKITSKYRLECKYGRIDIKAKLAIGQEIMSMCYLNGINTYGNWPYCGEMDFYDYRVNDNRKLCQAIVSKDYCPLPSGNPKSWEVDVKNVDTQFHIYSIEWSEDSIKFYTDNKFTGSYDRSLAANKEIGKEYETWPFDSPFYFAFACRPRTILDGDAGKEGWTKIFEEGDITTYESSMDVDYIRIYSLKKEEQTTTDIQNIEKKTSRVKIKSAKRVKKNRILVKFKKVKNAKKYQIQYATNKKFKKAQIKTTKKYSYTLKKLSKKKTYYIRVRGVNGTKKGVWSKVKKVK